MDLRNGYQSIKSHIVAIAPKFSLRQTDFPEIIGTGFFVSRHGEVCTCRHVVEACANLPAPPGYQGFRGCALVFIEVEHGGTTTWGWLPIEVHSIGHATVFGNAEEYMGPNPPDVSILLLNVQDTPGVQLAEDRLHEGEFVGFSGFPMGTRLLRAPGWLHQLGPSLHVGVVSAVLPHSLAGFPHGFLIHANTQGGASGSPVFRPDGSVVGMVYMTVQEDYRFGGNGAAGDQGATVYRVPTALTGCVAGQTIRQVIALSGDQAAAIVGRASLPDLLARAAKENIEPGKGILHQWNPQG
jgi:hypothetical protein